MTSRLPTAVAILFHLSLLAVIGCQKPDAPVASTQAPAQAPLTVRDDLGREVRVRQPVRRIISLSPATTETLFAIGAGDQVVGVTTFDNYPPEATKKDKVGGFARETISIEKVAYMSPDVVFSSGSLQQDLIESLERFGTTVVAMEPASYDDVIQSIALAGEITGHAGQAKSICDELRLARERVQQQVKSIPAENRPRVFYLVWDQPLRSASGRSFIGQLIEAAGGQNIFADLQEAYPLVSEEAVIEHDPEVIIAPAHGDAEISTIVNRPAWAGISAVRNRRIYLIDEDIVSRPGPRVGQALQLIHERCFPGDRQAEQTSTEPDA